MGGPETAESSTDSNALPVDHSVAVVLNPKPQTLHPKLPAFTISTPKCRIPRVCRTYPADDTAQPPSRKGPCT